MSAVSLGTRDGKKTVMGHEPRETHLHVIGASGQGKSYFLEHLIRQDILNGAGVCVIDPHGELYDNLVAWLAEQQIDRFRKIHLLNPSDDEWAVGFNPLCVGETDPTVRLGAMVDACVKVWGGTSIADTPRLAKCLRSVFYVLAHHQLSLLEAKQLTNYTAGDVREDLTRGLPNIAFAEEWQEFNAYPQREFLTYFESTNSRLLSFIASPVVARMIGQTERVIDFMRCMNERHIVLVNLAPKDKMDASDAQLIGSMLFSDLFVSAKRRSITDGKRSPFYCYVDECADYITDDIARMLDQTRKFGLHLILAHQRLEQLRKYGDDLYNAIMAGAQSKVVFKVDEDDTAEALARFLYRKELDLEEPKHILDKPVAVGQMPIWLHSESETHTRSETTAESHSEVTSSFAGASSGESEQSTSRGNEAGSSTSLGSSEGEGSASTSSSSWSVAEGASQTRGRSQSLSTQYEILPTTLYSLEEQIHKAIVAIRSLPKRRALGYMAGGGKPFRFSTTTIRPGAVLPSQVARFIERVNQKSEFTEATPIVTEKITARRYRTIEGTVIADNDDEFTIVDSPRDTLS